MLFGQQRVGGFDTCLSIAGVDDQREHRDSGSEQGKSGDDAVSGDADMEPQNVCTEEIGEHQPANGPATGEGDVSKISQRRGHIFTERAVHGRREDVLDVNFGDVAAEVVVNDLPDIASGLCEAADEDDGHRKEKEDAGEFQGGDRLEARSSADSADLPAEAGREGLTSPGAVMVDMMEGSWGSSG